MKRTRTQTISLSSVLVLIAIVVIIVLLSNNQSGSTSNPSPVGNVPSSSQGSSQTGNTAGNTSNTTANSASNQPRWGVQTKTSGCKANGALQDKACTPGDIFPEATKEKICVSGYSRSVRDVPTSVKDQVYAEYGITSHRAGQYEVDHLVSLELGGSNDISNLWLEPASPVPGFHEKDKVENYLHDQVCSGAISLQQAQILITTNWLAVYDQMGGQ